MISQSTHGSQPAVESNTVLANTGMWFTISPPLYPLVFLLPVSCAVLLTEPKIYFGEGNGTHSSTLAWKIPWMEEPGGLQSMGSLGVGHDWSDLAARSTWGFPGGASGKEHSCQWRKQNRCEFHPWLEDRGHDNPLQYSCLENPMDRGAWWATVHGITKSQTWLKWLSMHVRST